VSVVNYLLDVIPMCSTIRVAICGSGPSGLCQLHAFESMRKCGYEIPIVVCFEKQNDLGGQWNYSWRTGYDEYNEPVHSSMYQNLWTNLPKECSEFVDYTFDKHFGQSITSFPPRTLFNDYIRGYAEQNNIRQYIQFNTVVKWISFSEEKNEFSILIKDLIKDETRCEQFDYVIIATGHFSTPSIPYFDGIETFSGRLLHSHDFRSTEDFVNRNVLLIGNGTSAEDITLQLYKYGTKSITMSYRTKPKNWKWPNQICEVPLLIKVDKNKVYFKDGSFKEVDAIIYCTGYLHHFPFLDDNLRLKTTNSLYPSNLYKTIFWLNQPRLIYLGMQRLTFSFNIANIQSCYARDVILGKIILPLTKEQMELDIQLWKQKEIKVKDFFDYIYFNRDYINDLIRQTNYPSFNIDQMVLILIDCVKSRLDNIITYRDKTYTSVLTNTMAKQHHTPWIQEMDDTLQNFINK
jgi:trimethylamine monooxygenase